MSPKVAAPSPVGPEPDYRRESPGSQAGPNCIETPLN